MRERRSVDATLVFDGDCAFCTLCVQWMERWVPLQLRVVAWQLTDISALGVTQAEAEHAVQLVEPGGRRTAGARAVARLLVHAGPPWSVLGVLLQVPPVSWLAAAAYRLIAINRDRMPGGTAACALPQAQRDALRKDDDPAA
ncbi:MAG TPA: DCC1-like thiol-disulfide oxidoreductase family protein [Mycobacteriales bacterium]|nr:DCC1-like thiol-disulfide oxidoreductase family protein [Mycobacteriales bacterium]